MKSLNLKTISRTLLVLTFPLLSLLVLGTNIAAAGEIAPPISEPSPPPDENSRDLFATETLYTFGSDFRDDNGKLGHEDSVYNDFSYDHRFLITGKWYFRAGIEYERFDFGGTDNGLPDHLQSFFGHLALEYIVHDHAGAGIEIEPGAYFQDNITGDSIDVPWRIFVSIPVKSDKVFAVLGVGGSLYQHPPAAPGGGIIWLISDKLRLDGVFPRPAMVYDLNDDWEFRAQGNFFYESFRTDDVFTNEKKIQLHDAIVQYNEDRVGLQADFKGIRHVNIVGGVGCTVFREFDFFRADRRAKLDPAPYLQLALEARF